MHVYICLQIQMKILLNFDAERVYKELSFQFVKNVHIINKSSRGLYGTTIIF